MTAQLRWRRGRCGHRSGCISAGTCGRTRRLRRSAFRGTCRIKIGAPSSEFRAMNKRFQHVLVTGGAGYVGSNLVPKLLAARYRVTVLDLGIYGEVLPAHPDLRIVTGDLRNRSEERRG